MSIQDKEENNRINILDSIRGGLFIPMFVYHIFSTYDLSNSYKTDSRDNILIYIFGLVRYIYILLAGISLSMSAINKKKKDPEGYYMHRIKRSVEILIYASIITIISHFLYPDFGIKFGVLHFIGIGTLLLSPIADSKILLSLGLGASTIASICSSYPKINPVIDTITGASAHYSMADWFPLKQNLPLLILGALIGNIVFNRKKTLTKNKYEQRISRGNLYHKKKEQSNKIVRILEWMGRKSLELYIGHVIILLVIFYLIKNF